VCAVDERIQIAAVIRIVHFIEAFFADGYVWKNKRPMPFPFFPLSLISNFITAGSR